MAEDYVTKKDLESALERFAGRISHDVDEKLRQYHKEYIDRFDKVEEDQKEYRDENMNRLDDVMGELENIREDNMIGTYQIRELRENVDDHEKRITKLETS